MLLKITEKCSMGCSHCMNDAKPDGKHMSLDTFKDVIDFLVKHDLQQVIMLTGGEPTEHPLFPLFMGYIVGTLTKLKKKSFITVTTNGFWILDNISLAKEIVSGTEYVGVNFQVSADDRYYPKRIDRTKRIWREKGFVFCDKCVEYMYPQGRAKTNNYPYNRISSNCYNIRAISKQLTNPTFKDIIYTLQQAHKFCTPAIRIDGSISLGESDLCPPCTSIYDDDTEIVRKIKDFKCNGCYPLNENLSPEYKKFVE